MEAISQQISALGSSSLKVDKVTHYGGIILDEGIFIPKFYYDTMEIHQIRILQQTLEKKKHQQMLRKEYRKKKTLEEIRHLFRCIQLAYS